MEITKRISRQVKKRIIMSKQTAVFSNVRESKLKKSMRKRQCFKCEGKIEKGETYMNHQFRYDYRIITVSFCKNCIQEKEMEQEQQDKLAIGFAEWCLDENQIIYNDGKNLLEIYKNKTNKL